MLTSVSCQRLIDSGDNADTRIATKSDQSSNFKEGQMSKKHHFHPTKLLKCFV